MKTIILTLSLCVVGYAAMGQPAQVTTLALTGDTLKAGGTLAMGPDGHLYATNFARSPYTLVTFGLDFGSEIFKIDPEHGTVERFADGLNGPFAMAFEQGGTMLVTNTGLGTVSRVSAEGGISEFITPGSLTTGLAVAADSSIFVTKCIPPDLFKYPPNSTVPMRFGETGLDCLLGLTFDDDGNLYASFESGLIRKYSPEGDDLGFLASFLSFGRFLNQIAYSSADSSLYVTTRRAHRIWKVGLDGEMRVLAGSGFAGTADGAGRQASFINPTGLALSTSGDTLYVLQSLTTSAINPNSIRMITGVLNAETSPVATQNAADVPLRVALEQPYPNPFTAQTTIRYRLPTATSVRLVVFDAMGRRVHAFTGERQAPGTHTVVFDATGLPSGVYFYRLEAGAFQATGQMVRVR